jgi:MFS family permease
MVEGDASTDPSGVFAPGRRTLTAGLVLTVTVVAFEALAIATVMPLVEDELGDLHLYGWVFSAFFLGNLVGIVLAGRAADRMLPAVPFAIGLVLFGTGLVVGGLAPSMLVLVVGRALQGLGAGALPAVAYVSIGRGYAPALRPRMFALLSTAWVVPSLLGPAFSGFIGETIGWRWVFLGLVPLLVGIGAVAVAAVRRIPAPEVASEGASVVDALLVAGGAATLLAGLGAEQRTVGVGLVVLGLVLAVPAYRRLTPRGTLRAASGLPAAIACRGVLTFAFFASDAYVPLMLTDVRGLRAGIAGLALTAATLAWTTGAWLQERFVVRIGVRPLVRLGFSVILAGTVVFALAVSDRVPVFVGILGWGVTGLGMGLAYAPISLTVLGAATPGQEGAATSALQLTDVLGIALGTGVAGALIAFGEDTGWDASRALLGVYAMTVVVAAVGVLLAGRLPTVGSTPSHPRSATSAPGSGPATRPGTLPT